MWTYVLSTVVLLTSVLTSIRAADRRVNAVSGGNVTFDPAPFTGPLVRITWKHERNKIAELDGEIEYYRDFKGRTSLDKQSGKITISKLTAKDSGTYLNDINDKQYPDGIQLTVISPVSKPRTNATCGESECILYCKGSDPTDGHYVWKMDGKEQITPPTGILKVSRSEEVVGKEFICNYSNPVSYALSDPLRPFLPPAELSVGGIVGIVIALLVLLFVVAGLAYKFRGRLLGLFGGNAHRVARAQDGHPESGTDEALLNKPTPEMEMNATEAPVQDGSTKHQEDAVPALPNNNTSETEMIGKDAPVQDGPPNDVQDAGDATGDTAVNSTDM